jgi:cation:H+ antiporter
VPVTLFALTAALSLAASIVLVARLERVGERFGISEAALGLVAALAADGPEITASVTAIAGGHGTIGIGVTLGSNVFNLAALLGLSALLAGRIAFHRRALILEGGLGLWVAFLALAAVGGLIGPAVALLLACVGFVPYLAFSILPPAARARFRLPGRLAEWLAGALADEEAELAVMIRPQRGTNVDAAVAFGALVVVIVASVAMEEMATSIGDQAGLSPIVVGGLILAAVTSLPNAVAAVYLASRGRSEATLSEAFNSNLFNVIIGLLVPGALLGLAPASGDTLVVAAAYVAMTVGAVALAFWGRGLDRRSGSVIIVAYLGFAVFLALS